LALTPTSINTGAELPGLIGLHPLEQQSMLRGSHINLIVVSETTGLSSAGGSHILEPMSLVSNSFLEQGDNGPAEVLPLCRGEILGAGLVELTDLWVEFVVLGRCDGRGVSCHCGGPTDFRLSCRGGQKSL